MKVHVDLGLDIDVDAWCVNYGVDRTEVRQDVRTLVQYTIVEHLDSLGLLLKLPQEGNQNATQDRS